MTKKIENLTANGYKYFLGFGNLEKSKAYADKFRNEGKKAQIVRRSTRYGVIFDIYAKDN